MSLIGSVDTLWGTCISGWAANNEEEDQVIDVDVIVNSTLVATLRCNTFREDLRAAALGDGCKAFCFDPSAYLKPGRNRIEVRFSGTDEVVPRGKGVWVHSRRDQMDEWDAAFVAALEAYRGFTPECHVCVIGKEAAGLGGVFAGAGMPFRKLTWLDIPRDPCDIWLTEKADLIISWAWARPTAENAEILQYLAQDHLNRSGLIAIAFPELPGIDGQIHETLQACGAPDVALESLPMASGKRRIAAFAEMREPDCENPSPPPILAHIHVPKCAGTSFRVLQEQYFGTKHLGLYVDDTYFVFSQETLRGYLLQDRSVRALSSHHVRRFPHWLAGREMFYVTFLRDPIQQFVSYMTHIKKHYATLTSRSLLESVPPDAPHLPLREFARWLLTQDRDIPFRENHNVNFFSRHTAPETADRLAAAKTALGDFFFVGLSERMEESIEKLRARAGEAGLEFPPGPIPFENSSSDYRDDLSWINPHDEVGALLLHSVEKDRQLYEWAAARL